jgi:hypothetical protein
MNKNKAQTSFTHRAKQWLKKFPIAAHSGRKLLDLRDRLLYGRYIKIVNNLPLFAPASAGFWKARAELTILAANQTFPFLAHFLEVSGNKHIITNMVEAETLCTDRESKEAATQLKYGFDKYGSDKASHHDYHFIYGSILRNPNSVAAVLEVGLGSNNEDVVSNMQGAGKPGASLRAFRDFLPNAKISGADVDKRILFEEDRIRTFFVDQTDLHSFDKLGQSVGMNFDLIIDDGLHSPNANIAVLIFAFSRLKSGGWLVVEDIAHSALPAWQVIAALIPTGFTPHLISAKGGIVFAAERTGGC